MAEWPTFLADGLADDAAGPPRKHVRTGRPPGAVAFVERLEGLLGRALKPARRGLKSRARKKG